MEGKEKYAAGKLSACPFKLMMNESLPLPAECLKQSETTLVQVPADCHSKVLEFSTPILLPSSFKDQMI